MPGSVYDKVLSNAQEAKARDARLIGVTSAMNAQEASATFDDVLTVPEVEELLSPILAVVPLQLLAYHIAAILLVYIYTNCNDATSILKLARQVMVADTSIL